MAIYQNLEKTSFWLLYYVLGAKKGGGGHFNSGRDGIVLVSQVMYSLLCIL